jgi:hypothetical protein
MRCDRIRGVSVPIFRYAAVILFVAASPAIAADAPPADGVDCAYRAMAPEDREIALVMMAESMDQHDAMKAQQAETAANGAADTAESDASPFASEQMAEVAELLEESYLRCLDLYPWSSGQADAARIHAMLTLMGDAMAEALKLQKLDIAVANAFYDANRKKMANRRELNAAEKLALAAHLEAAGWPKDDQQLQALARAYVEMKMGQDMLRRAFDTGDFSKL